MGSSVIELAARVDAAVSAEPPVESDRVISDLIQKTTAQLKESSQACEELSGIILDFLPTLAVAASLSTACEDSVIELIAVAAERCTSAREIYTALAAALSEALLMSIDCCGNEVEQKLSSSLSQTKQTCCSTNFQRELITSMAICIARIQRRWLKFLEDYLSLVVRWFGSTMDDDEDNLTKNMNAVREAAAHLLQHYRNTWRDNAMNDQITEEESEKAEFLIKCAVLDVVAAALVHPARLEAASISVKRCILEAESTLSGKLARFKPALVEFLATGPARIISLPGISEDITVSENEDQERTMNTLGNAAALMCSLLLIKNARNDNASVSIESTSTILPPPPTSRMLHRLGAAVNALTDAAAHHHSIPLALLPLLTVDEFFRTQLHSQLEEGYASLLTPIILTLVTVMSYNPVEIVRNCAYECLNSLLDAAMPSTRLIVLQHMLHDDDDSAASSGAGPVVAIQRLRMEISSSSVYNAPFPFTQETVLHLVMPYLRRGAAPGWQTAEDVVRSADCMAAALNTLRFVLLQHSRVHRYHMRVEKNRSEAVLLLQGDRFRDFVDHHLQELYACVKAVLQDESCGMDIETLLAVQRLEEVLERTLEVAETI